MARKTEATKRKRKEVVSVRIKYCPSCRKSGKNITTTRRIFPKPCVYFVECPSCHYRSKEKRFKRCAVRAWNKEVRNS